ncbi:hypothetical protein B0H10DRAFT_1942248 [Mycena sp. CBHHK59/15]|nr:hypothetical protein B0H10DRAFT_1942248 [Mycena sp. CBHHK59/15]
MRLHEIDYTIQKFVLHDAATDTASEACNGPSAGPHGPYQIPGPASGTPPHHPSTESSRVIVPLLPHGTVFPESGCALEISFGTWKQKDAPVIFAECGACLQGLIPFLKNAVKRMTPSERDSDSPNAQSSHFPAPKQTLAPNTIIPSTSAVDLKQNKQATLATMGWQAWAPGAKEAHLKEASASHRMGMETRIREKEEEDEKKRERERVLAAERQRRRHREKKAQREAEDDELSDDNNINVILLCGADVIAHEHATDVATVSHAGTQGWREGRNGTKGGAIQKRVVTVNWCNPFLWNAINKDM